MELISSDKLFGDKYKHPSFGQLTFGSTQGTERALFGSSILHNNLIRMEIKKAEYNRSISHDWCFGRETLVTAYMSPTQFADAITGLGSAQGTPITFTYLKGEGTIKPPEYLNKRKQFEHEFGKVTDDILERLDNLENKVLDKNLPKWVSHELDVIKNWLKSNHPFMAETFEKQMDKSVTEAKGEIEAYMSNMVRNLGIKALKSQIPQLPESTQTKELE